MDDAVDQFGVEPFSDEAVDTEVTFNIGFEDGVEYFVGGKRVGVFLVGAKFGGGGTVDDGGGDDFGLLVAPAA